MKIIKRKKKIQYKLYCIGDVFKSRSLARCYIKDIEDNNIKKIKFFIYNQNINFVILTSIYTGLAQCALLGYQDIIIVTKQFFVKKWFKEENFKFFDKELTKLLKNIKELLENFNWSIVLQKH